MKYFLIHNSKVENAGECKFQVLAFWTLGFLCGVHFNFLNSSFSASVLISSVLQKPGFIYFAVSALLPLLISTAMLYLFPLRLFCCVVFFIALFNAYVFQGILMAFPTAPVLSLIFFSFARFSSLPILLFLWMFLFQTENRRKKLFGIFVSAFVILLLSVISYRWLIPFFISVLNS